MVKPDSDEQTNVEIVDQIIEEEGVDSPKLKHYTKKLVVYECQNCESRYSREHHQAFGYCTKCVDGEVERRTITVVKGDSDEC
ncbi:hypothetical protein [Halorubrum sp. DTA46]|uniref:hypothetical protein n=1 Tax=Halorubrum sp. DTA46 TaxID=3402162 RepID=UPI003AAD22D9